MRILFTFIGGYGHFQPLISVARAAEAAGHTVAVAGGTWLVPVVTEAGFTAFGTSEPRPTGAPQPAPPVPEPLKPWDPEEEARAFRRSFAERGATRHAAGVLKVAREWQPDVIVRDEVDFGSAIAAECYAAPSVTVLVLASGGLLRTELVSEPLNALRADYGLPPDPDLQMLDRDLVLSPFPAVFRSPSFPLPPTAFSFRPAAVAPAATTMGTPTVYLTLGTVFNTEAPDLFTSVLAGSPSCR